jgi:hypothetical protein
MRPKNPDSDIEAALRRWRPSADATFVQGLAQEVRAADHERRARHQRRWRVPTARSLLAMGLTAALFSALAAFGELGYAASGLDRAVSTISGAIHIGKHSGPAHAPSASAAADQYRKPKTCREKAKEDYDTKIAADRHAYRTRLAAARKTLEAAMRKCKTRACRLAAKTRYALEVSIDTAFRNDLMNRHHKSFMRLMRRCGQ